MFWPSIKPVLKEADSAEWRVHSYSNPFPCPELIQLSPSVSLCLLAGFSHSWLLSSLPPIQIWDLRESYLLQSLSRAGLLSHLGSSDPGNSSFRVTQSGLWLLPQRTWLPTDSSGQLPFLSGRPPRSLKSPQEVLKCRNLQVNDYVTGAGQLTRGKQGLFKQLSPVIWSKAP